MQRICVFTGSRKGRRPEYDELARRLGKSLVEHELGLVYGGGNVGLMGVLAETVLAGGGEVIGVIPDSLLQAEVGHRGVTRLHVVSSMHERKARMAELCDGFVALPGGLGTLEELFEVFTWSQLGIHRKPVALLDSTGYYAGLLEFLRFAAAQGFLDTAQLERLQVHRDPDGLIAAFLCYVPPPVPPLLGPDEI